MARSRYDVEINGTNKGLTTAVNNSMDELNKLDQAAQGLFSNMTGPLSNLQGGLNAINSLSPALRGLGAAGLAAGAGFAAFTKASQTVNTLTEIQTNTGVSIEMLQKLKKEFKDTGMEVDKFGDINKDMLDKLGDSLRAGKGGVADDLGEWGIKLSELTDYAYKAEGGIEAIIDVFYKMKAAGRSQAEITNAMETMASDASHLTSTLSKYSSKQEALNAINKQSAGISRENADAIKEFDRNIKNLQTNIDELNVKAVGPLIKELNELWEYWNRDWTSADFVKVMKDFWYGGDTAIAQFFRKIDGISDEGYSNESKKAAEFARRSREQGAANMAELKKQWAAKEQAEKKRKEQIENEQKERQKEADKLKAEQKRAAEEARKAAEEQIKIRREYVNSLVGIAATGLNNDILGSTFSEDQRNKLSKGGYSESDLSSLQTKEFSKSIKSMDMTGLSQAISDMRTQTANLEQGYKKAFDTGMLSADEYKNKLKELQQAQTDWELALSLSRDKHANDVAEMFAQDGWLTAQENMQLQLEQLNTHTEDMRLVIQNYEDSRILSHEQANAAIERLDKQYAVKAAAIARQETMMKIQMADDAASGIAGTLQGLLGEQNKVAQAAFAISKGISIANGVINAHEAATKSMALYPGPLGMAMAATSYAKVIGEVMSMKSMTLGQFHSGIDNVAETGDYTLQKGERVVDRRLNQDLKDYLQKNEQGQQDQQQQPIDASIHIAGSVMDERTLMAALKKQQQTLVQIVQDGQRRRM